MALKPSYRILDPHVHVWKRDPRFPYTQNRTPPAEDRTPEMLLDLMRQHGVDKTVIIQVRHYWYDNSYLASVLQQYPQYFRGVARVDPESPAAPDDLSRLVEVQKFQGVRLSPEEGPSGDWIRGPLMPPLWQRCQRLNVPMTILAPITRMPDILTLAARFPDLTVVVDHMADCPVDRPAELEKLIALARLPKVFVKISHTWSLSRQGFPWRDTWDYVRRLHQAFGPGRLMWATDWPVCLPHATYGQTLEVVRDHMNFLNETDREWMLSKTIERVWHFE